MTMRTAIFIFGSIFSIRKETVATPIPNPYRRNACRSCSMLSGDCVSYFVFAKMLIAFAERRKRKSKIPNPLAVLAYHFGRFLVSVTPAIKFGIRGKNASCFFLLSQITRTTIWCSYSFVPLPLFFDIL